MRRDDAGDGGMIWGVVMTCEEQLESMRELRDMEVTRAHVLGREMDDVRRRYSGLRMALLELAQSAGYVLQNHADQITGTAKLREDYERALAFLSGV